MAASAIGHVSPEAARGGNIALIQDGDIVDIDIPAGTLNVRVSEAELAERKKSWQAPEPKIKKGYLARYERAVSSASEGAVVK
jgi:dihydroxy-acid dehydratase